MPYALTCEIKPGVLDKLMQHRLDHLEYIRAHKDEILFGGPARSAEGTPETMIIVLKSDDAEAARTFIKNEPYNVSGEVFIDVKVRPWSQVMPPVTEHALDEAIASEMGRRAK